MGQAGSDEGPELPSTFAMGPLTGCWQSRQADQRGADPSVID